MTSPCCKAFAQSNVIDRQHSLGRRVSEDEMSSLGFYPPGDARQGCVERPRAGDWDHTV